MFQSLVNYGSFHQVGVKIQHVSNHHLEKSSANKQSWLAGSLSFLSPKGHTYIINGFSPAVFLKALEGHWKKNLRDSIESTSCLPPYPSRKNLQIPPKKCPQTGPKKPPSSPFLPPEARGPRPGWATKPNIFPRSPESVAAATKLPEPPTERTRFEEEEIPGTHTIHGTSVFADMWLIFVVNVSKLPVPRILWGSHMLRMYGIITKPFPLVKMWPFLHLSCGRKYSHPIRAHLGLFVLDTTGSMWGKTKRLCKHLGRWDSFWGLRFYVSFGILQFHGKKTLTANLGVLLFFSTWRHKDVLFGWKSDYVLWVNRNSHSSFMSDPATHIISDWSRAIKLMGLSVSVSSKAVFGKAGHATQLENMSSSKWLENIFHNILCVNIPKNISL